MKEILISEIEERLSEILRPSTVEIQEIVKILVELATHKVLEKSMALSIRITLELGHNKPSPNPI